MSIKKNKILVNFRLESDIIEKLKELTEKDPLVFASYARTVDAALFHFVSLPKNQQIEIIKKYLLKNL